MLALDGTDVGWLQAIRQDDELFVAQMFVDGLFQRRGIGTEMKRLTNTWSLIAIRSSGSR